MTDPRKDDMLDDDLKALGEVYRGARRTAPLEDGPPAALDDAIRAAARRAVHARPQSVEKTWFSRSSTPLAAAAVLVLTVSVGFLALNDPAVQVKTKGEDVALSQSQAVIVPAATAPAAAPPAASTQIAEPPKLEDASRKRAVQTPDSAKDEQFKRAEPARRDERPPVLAEAVQPSAIVAAPPAPPPPPAPATPLAPAAAAPAAKPVSATVPAPQEAVEVAPRDTVATTGSRVTRPQSPAAQPEASDRAGMQRGLSAAEAKRESAQTPAQVPSGDARQAKERESSALEKKFDFAADPARKGPVAAGAVAPQRAETRTAPAPIISAAPDAGPARNNEELRAKSAAPAKPVAPALAPPPLRRAEPVLAPRGDESAPVNEPAKPMPADRNAAASPSGGLKLGASAAGGNDNSLSADDWVKRILDLRKQGKLKEAEEELAKFRKRYPDYVLPEALRELK